MTNSAYPIRVAPAPLLAMIATTALWALAFIVPLMVPGASSLDITFGRYFAYGICSVFLLWRFGRVTLSMRDWGLAAAFAFFGNLLYYALLVLGIRLAGAGLAVPIIGLLPVTVALAGNWREGALPWRKLALPLLAVFIGLMLVNLARGLEAGGAHASGFGILCLVAPVIMWTWYAVANSAFLKRRRDVSASAWASAIGVTTLGLTLALFPLHLVFGNGAQSIPHLFATGEVFAVAFWSTVLGLGASWGAAALFNMASTRLPVTLAGQLIVFETIFGVLYVFLAEGRRPSVIELSGFALSILGIWLSIRVLQHTTETRS
ncbi:DMT family transporter [Dongia rigui]|uniref:DMT family transporter n=1 Tax=Dongia rigui TaxID=940149 RepID=A0ABU5E341_9PROT|nr:DMT family transporter [Dongia rigui]MDY0874007.1 DMT family transporter [Dongia rigui]